MDSEILPQKGSNTLNTRTKYTFKHFGKACAFTIALLNIANTSYALNANEEYAKKATLLKELIPTVTWPESNSPQSQFCLCLYGEFAALKPLNMLNGTLIEDKEIKVKKIKTIKEGGHDCQLIYIAKSNEKKAAEILAAFQEKPVLLVADFDGFARNGGNMNFMLLNGAYAINVNLPSMSKAQLQFDLKSFTQVTILPEEEDIPKN